MTNLFPNILDPSKYSKEALQMLSDYADRFEELKGEFRGKPETIAKPDYAIVSDYITKEELINELQSEIPDAAVSIEFRSDDYNIEVHWVMREEKIPSEEEVEYKAYSKLEREIKETERSYAQYIALKERFEK